MRRWPLGHHHVIPPPRTMPSGPKLPLPSSVCIATYVLCPFPFHSLKGVPLTLPVQPSTYCPVLCSNILYGVAWYDASVCPIQKQNVHLFNSVRAYFPVAGHSLP
eukprot:EG_transcript_37283